MMENRCRHCANWRWGFANRGFCEKMRLNVTADEGCGWFETDPQKVPDALDERAGRARPVADGAEMRRVP